MIAEILLGGLVVGSTGVLVYLYRDHVKNAAAQAKLAEQEAERVRLDEARRDMERQTRFRSIVLRELKAGGLDSFRLDDVAVKCKVSLSFAIDVAKSIYLDFLQKVVSDDVITPDERKQLAHLAKGFSLPVDWVEHSNNEAVQGRFKEKVRDVFADGRVTASELAELETTRRSLGLSREDVKGIAVPEARQAYLELLGYIADTGMIAESEKGEIKRLKKAAGLEDREAAALIRTESVDLFRRCFAAVVADGVLTSNERDLLAWFQTEIDLPNELADQYLDQIRRAERLSELRQGNLQAIRTKKLLEGGELCYYDQFCIVNFVSRNNAVSIRGELLITTKRVAFISDQKSFSFAPWKILDVDTKGESQVKLKVDGSVGNRDYFVGDADEVEAIFVGLAKRLKYASTETYSSTLSRHITPAVKREVWARDGGQCVQCSATEYLEFDHIIPHSQGGANTLGNIQILCRRCNNEKSDRI